MQKEGKRLDVNKREQYYREQLSGSVHGFFISTVWPQSTAVLLYTRSLSLASLWDSSSFGQEQAKTAISEEDEDKRRIYSSPYLLKWIH